MQEFVEDSVQEFMEDMVQEFAEDTVVVSALLQFIKLLQLSPDVLLWLELPL